MEKRDVTYVEEMVSKHERHSHGVAGLCSNAETDGGKGEAYAASNRPKQHEGDTSEAINQEHDHGAPNAEGNEVNG